MLRIFAARLALNLTLATCLGCGVAIAEMSEPTVRTGTNVDCFDYSVGSFTQC